MRFWFILLFISFHNLFSQDCEFILKGQVKDFSTQHFKSDVYLLIEETGQKTVTDKEGNFQFENLCAGDYHIKTSYLGFQPAHQFITMQSDNFIEIKIKHFSDQLNETVIHGKELQSLQQNNTITNNEIVENSNKSLGELLSKIQGVSSLKNGTVSYTHLTLPTIYSV